MASLFQGLPRAVLLSGPNSYKRPLRATASEATAPRDRRVAHWDHKRATCGNCQLIFLKSQSRVAGFCSVDCHTNAAYMAKIRQRANKAAEAHQSQPPQDANGQDAPAKDLASYVHTFGSFGLEERMEDLDLVPTHNTY